MELQPFKGVQVIDLTEGVAGPYAAMILADLGADVIKVERPEGDWGRILGKVEDGFSSQYIALNRNKRNISVNIQKQKGQEIFKKLAKKADIIITSFRPGVTEKYGIGYEEIEKINPNIIYGRISGYGYTGKLKYYTGVDTVIQANSGVMNHIGPADGIPYRTGFPIIDHVAGRDLVQGVQALYINKLKGKKIEGPIDVSLYATAAALQTQQWQGYFLHQDIPMRVGNLNPVIAPSGVYESKDNLHISIAVVRDNQWIRLCQALELPHLAESPLYETNDLRLKHRVTMEKELQRSFRNRTRSELIEILKENDITFAPVLNMDDVYHSEYFDSIPLVQFDFNNKQTDAVGMPFYYNSKSTPTNSLPPAKIGEQTEEILLGLNYSKDAINKFSTEGVIRK